MSSPKLVQLHSIEEFNQYRLTHCCMFDIKFYNLKPKLTQDHPLSASKCFMKDNVKEDNGRVVTADSIATSINEVDFSVLLDFYTWDYIDIWNFRVMEKGYLPTPFVKAILKLYEIKTTLKGSTNVEDLMRYMSAKGDINSAYGMAVMDIIQPIRKYEGGDWITEQPNIEEVFEKYNTSKSRFLYYPWGVWVR